jgi:4,5-dihydroxyphthalate decarboxylase
MPGCWFSFERGVLTMGDPLVLYTAIGNTPEVMPLWKSSVRSDRITLDMVEVEPLYTAFRRMVRKLEFDLSEMPVVTLAQAVGDGKPITALPVPVSRRFHHRSILCRQDSPIEHPGDLIGRRVGVRSYPQTSGVWARGILASEYGIPLERVTWVTQEDAHVTGYQEPPYVVRATSGKSLLEMLNDGEIDAVMGLRGMPSGLRSVIPDADAAALNWYRKTGVFPINHVIAVKSVLLEEHAWLAAEVISLFSKANSQAREEGILSSEPAPCPPDHDMHPIGLEANRASLQMLLNFAAQQALTPRRFCVDELFDAKLEAVHALQER